MARSSPFQTPQHVAAAATRQECAPRLLQRFAGAVDLLQPLVGAEDVNRIRQTVDRRLPHAVGSHQRVDEFDMRFCGTHFGSGVGGVFTCQLYWG